MSKFDDKLQETYLQLSSKQVITEDIFGGFIQNLTNTKKVPNYKSQTQYNPAAIFYLKNPNVSLKKIQQTLLNNINEAIEPAVIPPNPSSAKSPAQQQAEVDKQTSGDIFTTSGKIIDEKRFGRLLYNLFDNSILNGRNYITLPEIITGVINKSGYTSKQNNEINRPNAWKNIDNFIKRKGLSNYIIYITLDQAHDIDRASKTPINRMKQGIKNMASSALDYTTHGQIVNL